MNMKSRGNLIAAVDAGTTGTRCCIMDGNGRIVSGGYCPMKTEYPGPGLVEQDPHLFIELTFRAVKQAVDAEEVDPRQILGLCMTVQRNSFVPMAADGSFLGNMIIWQDQRGEQAHEWMLQCLKKNGMTAQEFCRRNGQPFGSFQCGFKALWIRRFREDIYQKAWKFVTPQAYLTHAFGAEGYTEENNNQSFWLVADADRQQIDRELCRVFDFDPDKFAEAVPPGTMVGAVSDRAAERTGLLAGTPIYLGSGDQNCGALGAGNYGTADIMSVCMGTAGLCIGYSPVPVRHPDGLCQIQGHPAGGYLMEAHSSSCMSSYRWAEKMLYPEEEMPVGQRHRQMTEAARSVPPGAGGVLFLPWLQGAACPNYNDAARGAYIGFSLLHGRAHLCRATMEGICFENRMMLETLKEARLGPVKSLRAVGGAANNDFWNQMQADIYGVPVETITAAEATALGAAIICAVSAGLYADYQEASAHMTHVNRKYRPDEQTGRIYQEIYDMWQSCYTDLSRESFRKIHDWQCRMGKE